MDPDFKGNRGQQVDCSFKQQGADLTVKCGTGIEMKGKVSGRKVTWGFEKRDISRLTEDRHGSYAHRRGERVGYGVERDWRATSGVMDKKGNVEAKKKR